MVVNIWIFRIRAPSSLELSKGLAPQFQAKDPKISNRIRIAQLSLIHLVGLGRTTGTAPFVFLESFLLHVREKICIPHKFKNFKSHYSKELMQLLQGADVIPLSIAQLQYHSQSCHLRLAVWYPLSKPLKCHDISREHLAYPRKLPHLHKHPMSSLSVRLMSRN